MSSTSPPSIHIQTSAQGTQVALLGAWRASELAQRSKWKALQAQLKTLANPRDAQWDLSAAEDFDHIAGQILWETWGDALPNHWSSSVDQRTIIERIAQLNVPAEKRKPRYESWSAAFQDIGAVVLQALSHFVQVLALLGQLCLDLLTLIRSPFRGPWRDISANIFRMGAQALPITALVGFLIGVVIAYLLAIQLRQLGADAFIVNVLGIAITRELGPLLAAILVAGRSGSAITAQIGVMRVNEEIDAMRVMGISTGYRLVLPRALALAIAMPLVSIWTTLLALTGGILASQVALGLSPAYFVEALPAAVKVANVYLACAKSVVFGLAIALIGCHWGLWVKPNTQSLGAGTTASVVTSITMVILIDAVFAIVFKSVGF